MSVTVIVRKSSDAHGTPFFFTSPTSCLFLPLTLVAPAQSASLWLPRHLAQACRRAPSLMWLRASHSDTRTKACPIAIGLRHPWPIVTVTARNSNNTHLAFLKYPASKFSTIYYCTPLIIYPVVISTAHINDGALRSPCRSGLISSEFVGY